MESGIIFGLAMALYGEITVKGAVVQSNFHNYKMLRMDESPVNIDVHIVPSNNKMGGAGECNVPLTAPALANAILRHNSKPAIQLDRT